MNKEKELFTDKLFRRLFIIIPLVMALVVAIIILKPFDTVELRKVRHTTVENVLKLEHYGKENKQEQYYVLFYMENDKDNKIIEKAVLDYYNGEKKLNSELKNIYLVKVNSSNIEQVKAIDSKIKDLESIPYMILVKDGSVSTRYDSNSEIANALYSALLK